MNLRSISKTRTAATRAALKRESTVPTPSMASENDSVQLSEAALRRLPRAKLQKVAKIYKIKANMKSDIIVQQLLSIQKKRHAEDDHEEGPSRKRSREEAPSKQALDSLTPENQVPPTTVPGDNEPQFPKAGPSASQPTSHEEATPIAPPHDKELFSGTESEMSEEEQAGFSTPVSSRAGTPPLAHTYDLRRCVRIMAGISAKDQALLKEVVAMDETTERLRARAKEVRDLAKAERSRRERMEDYFRYWQETEPRWDRRWIYNENLMSNREMRLRETNAPTGPPTVPAHQRDQETQESDGRAQLAAPVRAQRQALTLEELRLMRQAIVSKQDADRRRLESQHRREELDEDTPSEESSTAPGMRGLGGRQNFLSEDDVNELLS